jgi:uncharacterized linocin/CFP29 family protein
MIDEAALGAAKSQLAGRRLLEISGPYGFGYRAVDATERPAGGEVKRGEATAVLSSAQLQPVPMLSAGFTVAMRDIAAAEEHGVRLELKSAVEAAIATAHLEDKLIFEGNTGLGIAGLMTVAGAAKVKLGNWGDVGKAADDLIAAVNALDAAGFPGPYTAALAPSLYNALFLRYPQSDMLQMEHAREIITGGMVKAATLKSGGVVMQAGKHVATIMVGQDMTVAYVGPSGTSYEFVVVESLAPRVFIPEAVCVLEAGK